MNIIFKKYDKGNKLDKLNKKLAKNSNGRFEICKSKRGVIYLIDYDETGYHRVVRAYNEVKDILECMNIDFNEVKEV